MFDLETRSCATDKLVTDLEGDEHGGNSAESGKRRHSIVTLQNMLKKVSQSPFHNQYDDAEGSAVATHVTDNHQPHLKQLSLGTEDDYLLLDKSGHRERLHLSPQNGISEDLVKTNPFYSYYLESTNNGHEMENGRKTSEEVKLDAIFVPPPEFQSSPLGLEPEIKTVENDAKFSEPDTFQTHKHKEDLLLTSVLGQKTAPNGDFYDLTLKTPNLYDTNGAQTQNASKLWDVKSAEVLKDKEEDLFHALKGEDLLQSECSKEVNLFNKSSSYFVDPFKSPSDEDDLFRSSSAVATNPFYNTPTSEPDLFQTSVTTGEEQHTATTDKDLAGMSFSIENLDIFSSSSTNAVDPFQSPLTANLFQDFSSLDDPFGPTPSRSHNLLKDVSDGTPDIFWPRPADTRESMDLFMKTPSKTTVSTPSLSPSEMKLDVPASPDLFKKKILKSPPAVPPKPLHRPQEILLTTPQGSKHDILQPTPFSQASSLSPSPNQSPTGMDHVQVFRRPPRPLPRTRPPRPVKPPQPVIPVEKEPDVPKEAPKSSPKSALRSLPKPVFPRKPKTPKPKPVEPENFVVLEDILLIGQERCIDDWPEDSPEHNPDFKPAGKFKLRRESLKAKTDSDGGSGEDQDGSQSKKKKFKMSLLSRRSSKEKFPKDMLKGNSNTLPVLHKSPKENFTDVHTSVGENEDEELNEYRKKPMKTKVNQLFRRASTTSSVVERTHADGHLLQESKKGDLDKKSSKNNTIDRRWSEGNMLDDGTGEEEEDGGAHHEKTKKKVKVKFVPQRGFAITREKLNSEPKGAYGYTPRKGSKDKSSDEVLGAHGYTPHEKSKTDAFEDVEELKSQHLQSASKAKTHHYSPGLNEDEDAYGFQACKPKKSAKMKLQHAGRRSSKENMLESSAMQKKKSCFSDEEFEDEELNGMEACKPNSNHGPVPVPRKPRTANRWGESSTFSYHLPQQTPSEGFEEDEKTGNKLTKPAELYDDEADELEICKPKKSSKLKVFNKRKHRSKAMHPEGEDPQGAAFNEHLSEAAKAEWLAAQMDECAIANLEDEEEEGDTDSLMEWWYTVEKWDEVPSDEEDAAIQKDELKSFTILADKIHNGLRLFNKVFTERAEILWQSIILLHTIADDISEFHHKAKIAGITGGTTSAVGGVAAIAGLALAPVTFGASLLITAVGVGVAAAGGVTSASAAISDNVNRNHDRKKVEQVLKEYEDHLLDIAKILHFVNKGLSKLRGHPFLRSGTQHYSEDWEIRRSVQVISLVDSPVMRATELTDEAITSLQGLFKGMDKYFIKDTRELKKGCKKEIVAEIRKVANVLNESIVELNTIREELQDATGNI
ncbi:uncharacterized protein si:cabz01007807.1 isoform X3 [Melanotaenia boesemani]|uniref:uncharacterized protein si:cabz01007807.1 isoform X3 n=1 Tax=Melanotaenia boesemani TaxID=1250792 RepID=UPI001C05BD01|nr:uncharacterized protein si:cabz01007807.1 isoform X3 [Melanotaenia boesemani]